jgi:anti-anti-sigma factor
MQSRELFFNLFIPVHTVPDTAAEPVVRAKEKRHCNRRSQWLYYKAAPKAGHGACDVVCDQARRQLMGLKVTVSKHKDYPIVKLEGRVIGVDDRKFGNRMETLFKKNIDKIIVDVSDTEFIDSHGVGIIVYYHTLMRKGNRELLLLNSNPNPVSYMARLFEMTNLNKVLTVVNSLDAIS